MFKAIFFNPEKHTADETIQWAWLRAVEWLAWPLFLSQPVVPILIANYPWVWVIAGVLAANFIWRATIATFYVSMVVDMGPVFVATKWIAAPASAAFIYFTQHDLVGAAIALLWPWLGPVAAGFVMLIPNGILAATPLGEQAQVGLIQRRFIKMLGTDYDIVGSDQPTLTE